MNPSMNPPLRILSFCLGLLLAIGTVSAHQVPNLTIESEFQADGTAELRVNLDPRLFLAEDPTTLPPIPASWLLTQSEAEKAETWAKAEAYVRSAVTPAYSSPPLGIELVWEFVAIDGGTGMAFTEQTAEVHLLAKAKMAVPAEAKAYTVAILMDAKAPAVLLNSFAGTMERRPQILFPGETSRPFPCRAAEE